MSQDFYIEELAKVIYDSAKSKKEINEDYINKVVEPIIIGESLQNYVGKVEVDNRMKDFGEYEIERGIVRINLFETLKDYKLEKNVFWKWEKMGKLLAKYSYISECVFHEIGHAYLLKRGIEGDKENLEVQLLNLICKEDIQFKKAILEHRNPFLIMSLREQSNKLAAKEEEDNAYDFALDERLVEIFSYELLLKVAEVLQVENLENYQKWQLYKAYLQGYKKTLYPTLHYLECVRKEEIAESIKIEELNLDVLTRMKYGLRITDEEYNKIKREKKRIKRTVR